MFSPFWNKTITVFTPFINADKINWYKYILNNVFFKDVASKSLDDEDYVLDQRTKIRIPISNNYLPFNEWKSNSNKNAYFSLSHESIIIQGNVADILLDNDSGAYLFDKYTCTKPQYITDNRYAFLPHIAIVGD